MKQFAAYLAVIILFSCRSLVTTFDDIQDAVTFTAPSKTDEPVSVDNLKIMTWNIRFGAARIPWFGDSCGDRVLMTESDVIANMDSIVSFINTESPDILLIQEIDISSKRSAYMNQVQYILEILISIMAYMPLCGMQKLSPVTD